ncbi:MAG: protein kinase, partial [Vicinamibacterales bacterium]
MGADLTQLPPPAGTPPSTSAITSLPAPGVTSLPTSGVTSLPTGGGTSPPGANAATYSGPTMGITGAATSLESPSPRPTPGVKAGDGPFQPGQQVSPRYTIIRILGMGGMGAVYQAFDHELGVAVAIKVIRPAAQSDATAAKELEQRFKRELVLARQVTHKYVVRIHDLGEVDGIKYLTMPFVEGETLAQLLKRVGTLPVTQALPWARQIAQGLAAAHEKGVIHRDLKPENIMVEKPSAQTSVVEGREGGDALIMDFGIARSVEHGGTQTAAGSVIGTLEYMAPEQAQGGKVDQRADIYAFGLIIYDMIVGRQRLAKKSNPMTELLERLTASPPSPRSVNPKIPEALDAVVMKCLAPSADDRYATSQEVVRALERLTDDGHIRVDELHPAPVVIVTPARPYWQLAVAAVVLASIFGGGGWYLSNRGTPKLPAVKDPISVLIADFNNKTGDPVFDGVVEQALGLGIEGASFITTYPRRDALRAAAVIKPGSKLDETTSRLVARREGVGLVLAGDIEQRGTVYHITTRGLGADNDGPPLYTVEADAASKAEILETVGSLAGKVRTALGDTAVPKDGPAPNETFTAASLEAAKAYAEGQGFQAAGKREEAIAKYQLAVKLDPNLGRAYSGMAAQYVNLGRADEAQKYYDEALKLIDRMTDREKFRTRGSYYLFARKVPEAIKEYTALVAAFPGDSAGQANLALAYFYDRNMQKALEEGQKAIAMSRSITPRSNATLYAMYAGQFETAITASDEVLKLNPRFEKAFLERGLSEVGLGRGAAAVKTFENLKGTSPTGASYAFAALADLALYEGRTKDAIAILNDGIASDTAAKNLTGVALKRVALADARLAQGDTAGAAREAEQAAAASQSLGVQVTAGLVLARTGKAPAALKIADALAQKLEADPQAYARLLRAEVSLAQNQARAAFDHARAAHDLADVWIGRVILARADLELGQFAEATSELDAAIKRQGEATALALDEWPTFRYFPQVYYYKGLAQDGLKSP